MKSLTVRANLARRGLLATQLQPYEDPERGWINPRADAETVAAAWDFIAWLAKEVS